MPHRARIALLIDTATTWGSGLIEGIAEYAHAHEDWQFLLGPRGKYDRSLLPADWGGQGIIARITNQEMADHVVDGQLERGQMAGKALRFAFWPLAM